MDDGGDAAADCSSIVHWKGLVERLVRSEDLAGVRRDACRLVSDMNRSFEIPVQEVDSGASGYMAKHMSSNTIPSFFPVNLPRSSIWETTRGLSKQ